MSVCHAQYGSVASSNLLNMYFTRLQRISDVNELSKILHLRPRKLKLFTKQSVT